MAAMGDLVWPDLEVEDEHAKEDRSCDLDRTAGTMDLDLEGTGIVRLGPTGLASP